MEKTLFPAATSRLVAATLGTLLTSTVLTAAMPAYLPFGQGDNIAGPILLFPFVWLAVFLYCLLINNISRVWVTLGLLLLSHGLIIFVTLNYTAN